MVLAEEVVGREVAGGLVAGLLTGLVVGAPGRGGGGEPARLGVVCGEAGVPAEVGTLVRPASAGGGCAPWCGAVLGRAAPAEPVVGGEAVVEVVGREVVVVGLAGGEVVVVVARDEVAGGEVVAVGEVVAGVRWPEGELAFFGLFRGGAGVVAVAGPTVTGTVVAVETVVGGRVVDGGAVTSVVVVGKVAGTTGSPAALLTPDFCPVWLVVDVVAAGAVVGGTVVVVAAVVGGGGSGDTTTVVVVAAVVVVVAAGAVVVVVEAVEVVVAAGAAGGNPPPVPPALAQALGAAAKTQAATRPVVAAARPIDRTRLLPRADVGTSRWLKVAPPRPPTSLHRTLRRAP